MVPERSWHADFQRTGDVTIDAMEKVVLLLQGISFRCFKLCEGEPGWICNLFLSCASPDDASFDEGCLFFTGGPL